MTLKTSWRGLKGLSDTTGSSDRWRRTYIPPSEKLKRSLLFSERILKRIHILQFRLNKVLLCSPSTRTYVKLFIYKPLRWLVHHLSTSSYPREVKGNFYTASLLRSCKSTYLFRHHNIMLISIVLHHWMKHCSFLHRSKWYVHLPCSYLNFPLQ